MAPTQILQQRFEQAFALHQQAQLDEANQAYLAILDQDPTHIEAIHLLGLLNAEKQDFTQAIAYFEQAVSLNPTAPAFYNNLGNAYKALGNLSLAKENYLKAIELFPHSPQAYNYLGNILLQENDCNAALFAYRQAIELKPDYDEAKYNLGLVFLKNNQLPEALKQFSHLVEQDPGNLRARQQFADLLLLTDKIPLAIQNYQLILESQPENLEAFINLAACYIKQKNHQQALACYTSVLCLDNQHIIARSNIAAVFMQDGNFANAYTHYQEVLAQNPNDSEANYNCGVALQTFGKLDEAIVYFNNVITTNPEHCDAWLNLGAIALKQTDRIKALTYFEKALRISPNNKIAQFMRATLQGEQSFSEAPTEYVKTLFDNYAHYFDQHLTQTLRYQLPTYIREMLIQYTSNHPINILDLGCGTGLSGLSIRDLTTSLVGIDLSQPMLSQAKKRNCYDELIQADFTVDLPIYQQVWDAIIAVDAFLYLGNLENVFRLVSGALANNGVFIFSIETTETSEYYLQSSGRYAHNPFYIQRLAVLYGLDIRCCATVTGRIEDNKPLYSTLFVLNKS